MRSTRATLTGFACAAGLCLLVASPVAARGQRVTDQPVAARHVVPASSLAEAPLRWDGPRACAVAVARSAAVGSVLLGATFYVLSPQITTDRRRAAQGGAIGAVGGAAVGGLMALSETPCWPWN